MNGVALLLGLIIPDVKVDESFIDLPISSVQIVFHSQDIQHSIFNGNLRSLPSLNLKGESLQRRSQRHYPAERTSLQIEDGSKHQKNDNEVVSTIRRHLTLQP